MLKYKILLSKWNRFHFLYLIDIQSTMNDENRYMSI